MSEIDLPTRSREELYGLFYVSLPAEIPDEPTPIHLAGCEQALQIVGEFRRRAIEKQNIGWLRDAHTLFYEVEITLSTLKQRVQKHRENTGLVLPG